MFCSGVDPCSWSGAAPCVHSRLHPCFHPHCHDSRCLLSQVYWDNRGGVSQGVCIKHKIDCFVENFDSLLLCD